MEHSEIKKIIEELLLNLGISFKAVEVVGIPGSESPTFVIRTDDSGILIGKNGEHFSALKHLVKRIIAHKAGAEEIRFNLDVNDYQARLLLDLRNKIKIMGDRALSFKVDIELEPMSSYERMMVHSYFEENPELATESVGEGLGRRVVIRYRPDKLKNSVDHRVGVTEV